MFQNKQDCPLILDCENKSPSKNSNILLNGTSTYVLSILQKKTYMYMYDMRI